MHPTPDETSERNRNRALSLILVLLWWWWWWWLWHWPWWRLPVPYWLTSIILLCLALSKRTNNSNDLARVRPWPDLILMQTHMTSPNDLSTRMSGDVESFIIWKFSVLFVSLSFKEHCIIHTFSLDIASIIQFQRTLMHTKSQYKIFWAPHKLFECYPAYASSKLCEFILSWWQILR